MDKTDAAIAGVNNPASVPVRPDGSEALKAKPVKSEGVKISKVETPKIEAHENAVKDSALLKHATKNAEEALSVDETLRLVEQLKQALPRSATALRFVVDEVLDKPIVSVIDQKSGELIRQLPSEEVVRAARNIEIMRGILFDRKS